MSKWDDFKSGISSLAGKTANKTRELTGAASIKIKIANKEADRDREYKLLGKLTYAKLKNISLSDGEDITVKISETLEKLDNILLDIKTLKQQEAELKANKEAERAARDEARRIDDDYDEVIMDQFNAARKEADEEYEKAKQAAEDAL